MGSEVSSPEAAPQVSSRSVGIGAPHRPPLEQSGLTSPWSVRQRLIPTRIRPAGACGSEVTLNPPDLQSGGNPSLVWEI